jgi:hypothetical protein
MPSKPKSKLSEKQQKSDDELRNELQNFDLKRFDQALKKAIKPTATTLHASKQR